MLALTGCSAFRFKVGATYDGVTATYDGKTMLVNVDGAELQRDISGYQK
jgi:hypothetical protein